jgi:hypothetical protein
MLLAKLVIGFKESFVVRVSQVFVLGLVVGLVGMLTPNAEGHMAFKKQLAKKYAGTKVSCNACHIKGKPKTERNDFGKLFAKEFKAQKLDLSAGFKAKPDKDAKKEYIKAVMVPEFDKALKKIKEMTNAEKEKYDDLIKTAKLDGIKIKVKK